MTEDRKAKEAEAGINDVVRKHFDALEALRRLLEDKQDGW